MSDDESQQTLWDEAQKTKFRIVANRVVCPECDCDVCMYAYDVPCYERLAATDGGIYGNDAGELEWKSACNHRAFCTECGYYEENVDFEMPIGVTEL